jgi:hypothetical protein
VDVVRNSCPRAIGNPNVLPVRKEIEGKSYLKPRKSTGLKQSEVESVRTF